MSQLGFYMVHGVHGSTQCSISEFSCLGINGRLLELCISCSVHVPERCGFRLSDALDVQNSPHCLQNSNEERKTNLHPLHISISLALATGDSIASGASRLRTLKMMGKPWPSPCRSE